MLHAHVEAVRGDYRLCAILGELLVVTLAAARLSLFMAAVVVPDTNLLPLLCIVMLPHGYCWRKTVNWPPTVTNLIRQRGHVSPLRGLPAPRCGTQ